METWLTSDAAEELAAAYGFRIRATLPMRSVVGLLSDKGRLISKRYGQEKGMSYRRLLGIVKAKEALARRGLVRPYLTTVSGEPLFAWLGAPVTVEGWVKGRHVDLRDRRERLEAVRAVARLHRQRIAIPSELKPDHTLLHKLSGRLQRSRQAVEAGRLVGISQAEWGYFVERALRVLRVLSTSKWESFIMDDKNAGVFCHRDLAPHNIMIERGSPATLIDFDLAGMDSPIYDLYQLFDHVTYRAFPPQGWAEEMLRAYEQINPLSRRQRQALALLQSFPSLLLREVADLGSVKGERARDRLGTRIRYVRTLEEERSIAIP